MIATSLFYMVYIGKRYKDTEISYGEFCVEFFFTGVGLFGSILFGIFADPVYMLVEAVVNTLMIKMIVSSMYEGDY